MLEDGNDFDLENASTPPPAAESSNRSFLTIAGILAGLVFLSIICVAVYVLWLGPRLTASREATQAAISTQNQQLYQAMTATSEALLWTTTPLSSPLATELLTVSPTSVVAVASSTATQPNIAQTATISELQTRVAQAQLTSTTTILGGMPTTGFADQVGLPGLIIMAVALTTVILIVRRLRKIPVR